MIAITNITPSPWSETGFLREYSPHIVETAKNPVSLLLAGPETGFFENYSLRLVEVAKNPVSLRLKMNLNRKKFNKYLSLDDRQLFLLKFISSSQYVY
jgi:hypothetical protein